MLHVRWYEVAKQRANVNSMVRDDGWVLLRLATAGKETADAIGALWSPSPGDLLDELLKSAGRV